jgi:hypothetical protein
VFVAYAGTLAGWTDRLSRLRALRGMTLYP